MIENHIKTVLLLGILTGILLGVGSFFGKTGLTIAIIFVVLMNFITYFFSDRIVLRMYNAHLIEKHDHQKLHQMVEEICRTANIPKPKLYVMKSDNLNAFATGRNPKHASVAFTTGILNTLNERELKGVTAHELAHVKNRDILIATIAATIAGVISYVAQMAQFAAIFGGGSDDDGNSLIHLLLLAIVAPIAAVIIQLAISRAREYIADNTGAKLIKDPLALASALGKLEHSAKTHPLRHGNEATASLFIVNPFRGKAIFNLFSTHPDINDRIKRLKEMRMY
jgi:heat shock protein HtpX